VDVVKIASWNNFVNKLKLSRLKSGLQRCKICQPFSVAICKLLKTRHFEACPR